MTFKVGDRVKRVRGGDNSNPRLGVTAREGDIFTVAEVQDGLYYTRLEMEETGPGFGHIADNYELVNEAPKAAFAVGDAVKLQGAPYSFDGAVGVIAATVPFDVGEKYLVRLTAGYDKETTSPTPGYSDAGWCCRAEQLVLIERAPSPAPKVPARRRRLDTLLKDKTRRAVLVKVLERLEEDDNWVEYEYGDVASVAGMAAALGDAGHAAVDGDRDAYRSAVVDLAAICIAKLEDIED